VAGRTREHAGKVYTVSGAHPAADLFPWLPPDELQQLADDIKENKQKEDIKRWRGLIADGRNRELACLVAGVRPRYFDLPADYPEELIIRGISSANVKRRHLTASQRAMIAAQLANMRQGERTDREPSATLPKVSQADAAEQLNVSTRSVTAAAKVKDEAPELVAPVLSGKLPVALAVRAAGLDPEDRGEIAGADDPAEEARHKLNGTLPEPMHDCGKKPLPPWMVPGNKVDPDHPFAALLHKFSAWSAEVTKALKTPGVGTELLWTLADLANMTTKVRFVAFTSEASALDNGTARSTAGKFVGFYALRQIVKLVGKRRKRLTRKMIQKTFLEALNASEQDMLDSEVWE
jgi:hypothetical protein